MTIALSIPLSGTLIPTVWADTTQCIEEVSCYGTTDSDVITGTVFIEEIFAIAGTNAVYAFGGGDHINGDEGNDRLEGNLGDDDLYGGPGGDQFWCNSGVDTIHDYSQAEGDKIMSESDCEIINPST